MQIIEVSVVGVRSAVITLERPGTPLRFVLYPMIHVGTPAFYHAVSARVAESDLAVLEGVSGRSVRMWALTLAYRAVARRRDLVVQRLDRGAWRMPVINPDMTAAQFRQGWQGVALAERLLVWCLIPPVAFAMVLFGSRRLLTRMVAVSWSSDWEPADAASSAAPAGTSLNELILGKRDALLVGALTSIHEERSSEPLTVAVVYGAGHMPGVIRAVHERLGYRPHAAEWLTVWD